MNHKTNIKELQKKLKEIEKKVTNLNPLLNQIGNALVYQTQENFESGSFFGKKWKVSERAEKEGGETLQDRRTLFNSITHEVSNNTLKVGTNIEYAGVHQFGTNKAGRGKKTVIDARPFLPMDENTDDLHVEGLREVKEVIKGYFN